MRKTFVLSAVLVVMLFVLFPMESHAGSFEKLDDGVYAYIGLDNVSAQGSFGANAGIVVGNDGILVVDTLVSAKTASRFLEDIRKISDKPVLYVVNTHGHLDHALGNSVFVKEGGVVVAHSSSRLYVEQNGEYVLEHIADYGLTADDMAGTEISVPKISFTDRLSIDLGGIHVDLINAGSSHTQGSVIVFVPETKTVFAGDVLFTGFHPFMGEGDIPVWLAALDLFEGLDAKKIVPGHGPVSGKDDIKDMKEYLVAFDRVAKKFASESDDIDVIVAKVLKAVPERPNGEFLVKGNIQMKYLGKH